jgi:ATP-dependent DNA helicase RecG
MVTMLAKFIEDLGYRMGQSFHQGHGKGEHTFYPDFVNRESQIIVEVDGDWHNRKDIKEKDERRDQWFELQGYDVLRFKNEEIDKSLNKVVSYIKKLTLAKQLPPGEVFI